MILSGLSLSLLLLLTSSSSLPAAAQQQDSLTLLECLVGLGDYDGNQDNALDFAEFIDMLNGVSCLTTADMLSGAFLNRFQTLACQCQEYERPTGGGDEQQDTPCSDFCQLNGPAAARLYLPGVYPSGYVVGICNGISSLIDEYCGSTIMPTSAPATQLDIIETPSEAPTFFSVKVPPAPSPLPTSAPLPLGVVEPPSEAPTFFSIKVPPAPSPLPTSAPLMPIGIVDETPSEAPTFFSVKVPPAHSPLPTSAPLPLGIVETPSEAPTFFSVKVPPAPSPLPTSAPLPLGIIATPTAAPRTSAPSSMPGEDPVVPTSAGGDGRVPTSSPASAASDRAIDDDSSKERRRRNISIAVPICLLFLLLLCCCLLLVCKRRRRRRHGPRGENVPFAAMMDENEDDETDNDSLQNLAKAVETALTEREEEDTEATAASLIERPAQQQEHEQQPAQFVIMEEEGEGATTLPRPPDEKPPDAKQEHPITQRDRAPWWSLFPDRTTDLDPAPSDATTSAAAVSSTTTATGLAINNRPTTFQFSSEASAFEPNTKTGGRVSSLLEPPTSAPVIITPPNSNSKSRNNNNNPRQPHRIASLSSSSSDHIFKDDDDSSDLEGLVPTAMIGSTEAPAQKSDINADWEWPKQQQQHDSSV